MPSLRDIRSRITSVKSTRKITSAMKMVAASKLRRAQEHAQSGQPYAEHMGAILGRLAAQVTPSADTPRLLAGTGREDTHLLVVVTSDRGLCAGFNGNIIRAARVRIRELFDQGKNVKIVCVGRKGREALRRDHDNLLLESFADVGRSRLTFGEAGQIARYVIDLFDSGEFDVCTLLYNRFRSVVKQEPVFQQIIPFSMPRPIFEGAAAPTGPQPVYAFEPGEEKILEDLLPRNIAVQLYRALLDSAAGEHAARMTAMDNATRNAGDMIGRLTLNYNRARQAAITRELIEIISGAEAL